MSYLKDNEEYQYSVEDLMYQLDEYAGMQMVDRKFSEDVCDVKTLKSTLLKEFGDDIIITATKKQKSVVCFLGTGYKILSKAFYEEKSKDPEEERMIDTIISKRKKGYRKAIGRKVASLTQDIMSAARPRSFLSTIQVGLAVHMHRTFGSANAVNVLHNLSFAASYKECKKYEVPVMLTAQPEVIDSFHQWIFDNADVNIRTLDGIGKWHGMGGALAVTPVIAVNPASVTIRLKTIPTNDQLASLTNSLKIP